MRYLLVILVVVFGLLFVRLCLFTVDATEFVYLTQFGRHVATFDGGAAESDAGLHLRWPWPIQSIQRFDRRLQTFDLDSAELLTHDAEGQTIDKTLIVDAYVCWRIADREGVDRFYRTLGNLEYARSVLGKRINSQLGAAIGQMGMDDLISTQVLDNGQHKVEAKMEFLRQNLLAMLRPSFRQDYGIDLVDLRLRRFNHPAGEVRRAIFERIASERNKKAEGYLSDGDKQAKDIRSKAEKAEKDMLNEAEAKAKTLRGQAEAEADLIRNQAHAKDPEFYVFLKRLEFYQSMLGDSKALLLLSTHRPLFDQLFAPPRLNGMPASKEGGK